MNSFTPSICPRCDSPDLKYWEDLSDEEQYLVERLPFFAEAPLSERKKHRFCTRCWYEETDRKNELA